VAVDLLLGFARSSLKTVLKNDCSKCNLSKKSVTNLSLLLCCLVMEKTI